MEGNELLLFLRHVDVQSSLIPINVDNFFNSVFKLFTPHRNMCLYGYLLYPVPHKNAVPPSCITGLAILLVISVRFIIQCSLQGAMRIAECSRQVRVVVCTD